MRTEIKADLGEHQRVETGPLKINDDWTGLFIRGDNVMGLNMQIDMILSVLTEEQKDKLIIPIAYVNGIINDGFLESKHREEE